MKNDEPGSTTWGVIEANSEDEMYFFLSVC